MKTLVDIPESILRRSQEIAHSSGSSVEEIIVRAIEHGLPTELKAHPVGYRVELPLHHSKEPGTLDLSNFNFDDLLT